ncbi:MAG: MalY/PatB family protein [Lachnospiraceae bacterium]
MAEKNLDFDQVIDRRGTDCLKYDFALKRGLPKGVLPLWVADMDFKISSYIQEALYEQVEHGIYGYTDTLDEYYQAVRSWIRKHYEYDILEEEIFKTPGVVYAIAMAVQAYTKEGEAVLIQQPVYYPFSGVIRDNGRKLVSNDLVYDKDNLAYHIDFADFEKKIVENNVKLFLLCNPHNPVGRAWKKEELLQIGEICSKHGVIVFSDEIHADFIWNGKHQPFLTVKEGFEDFCVTATAPSKTFNLAGLQVSNLIIKNKDLRQKFRAAFDASGYSQLNAAGLIACKAAYQHGEEWYEAVKKYIHDNIDFMDAYLKENIPQIKMIYPEATYLVWVDCSKLGLTDQELEDLVVKKANLWLDSGRIFGKVGRDFQRFNIACPRSILRQALDQFKEAVHNS